MFDGETRRGGDEERGRRGERETRRKGETTLITKSPSTCGTARSATKAKLSPPGRGQGRSAPCRETTGNASALRAFVKSPNPQIPKSPIPQSPIPQFPSLLIGR